MRRHLVRAGVLGVGSAPRTSQAETLAALVAAAVPTRRATLANLGRALAGSARCKHKIERAARVIANDRVTVADAMTGVIARLARRNDTPLVVALDWVEVRDLHTPVAADRRA